jgi:hypothetical protein
MKNPQIAKKVQKLINSKSPFLLPTIKIVTDMIGGIIKTR